MHFYIHNSEFIADHSFHCDLKFLTDATFSIPHVELLEENLHDHKLSE